MVQFNLFTTLLQFSSYLTFLVLSQLPSSNCANDRWRRRSNSKKEQIRVYGEELPTVQRSLCLFCTTLIGKILLSNLHANYCKKQHTSHQSRQRNRLAHKRCSYLRRSLSSMLFFYFSKFNYRSIFIAYHSWPKGEKETDILQRCKKHIKENSVRCCRVRPKWPYINLVIQYRDI